MAEHQVTWKTRVGELKDYLFGRNMLIGVAAFMLLTISGYATWSGMSDFILGAQSDGPVAANRKLIGISVSNEGLVIAIVVALTFLMWLSLRETFGAKRLWRERLVTFPLYLFLALWSVGFGYGFWWSLIAGQEATRNSLSGLQEDARDAAAIVAARLDAVKIQLDNVVSWSDNQMVREETNGGSCGVPSGAGRGPLYNARKTVRDSVASLRDNITNSWLNPVKADIEKLRLSAARLEGKTVSDRQRSFETMASNIRGRARNIAARSNALGKSTSSEMRALADSVTVAPNETGFSCYDPTLAQRLRQAADQASEPAVLNLRQAAFNEGPAGVANAVKRLWGEIGGGIARGARYVMSGFKDSGPATAGGGLTGRDLIALLAALGIDLGLFALTVLNPPVARSRLPGGEVSRQINAAINTAIASAPGITRSWIRKHFIHHSGTYSQWMPKKMHDSVSVTNSASYFVVPNLYSVEKSDTQDGPSDAEVRALAMNHLAGVLSDLDLIRAISVKEAKHFIEEEKRTSRSDIGWVRKEHVKKQLEEMKKGGASLEDIKKYETENKAFLEAVRTRNHGIFSKAERAMRIAGWSERAAKDVVLFRLIDTEGLTPLLAVLDTAEDENDEKAEAQSAMMAKPASGRTQPKATAIAAPSAKASIEDKSRPS